MTARRLDDPAVDRVQSPERRPKARLSMAIGRPRPEVPRHESTRRGLRAKRQKGKNPLRAEWRRLLLLPEARDGEAVEQQ